MREAYTQTDISYKCNYETLIHNFSVSEIWASNDNTPLLNIPAIIVHLKTEPQEIVAM